jgi:tripartite motif-containing protein 71
VGSEGWQLGRFQYPEGICIQPSTNHLLVCDSSNNRVQVFSDQDQPLYAIGNTSGEESRATGEFDRPIGVGCAPDDSIAVADMNNHRVQLLDASGRFVRTFGKEGRAPQELNCPFDVCHLDRQFSPSSATPTLLLVADLNKRLAMWSPDGHHAISQIDVGGYAYGVCTDLNGFIYVSVERSMVKIYDPRNHALLQVLGSQEEGSAPGQLKNPMGLCVDDTNTLMVAEKENCRVQFFD